MYNTGFYKDLFERTVATFAQAFIAYVGTAGITSLSFDWWVALSVSGLAALLAVLKGFAAFAGNHENGASFGTATPRSHVAATETSVHGQYEAAEASAYPEGTPVDVVLENDGPTEADHKA